MLNPLHQVLAHLDSSDTTIDFQTLYAWPEPDRKWMLDNGILAETMAVQRIQCPACQEPHVEDVVRITRGEVVRCYVPCPEHLRVPVNADHLRRWQVNPNEFARVLCCEFDCDCKSPREICVGRAWQLGRFKFHNETRMLVLARGMSLDGASMAARSIGSSGRTVVLVPWRAPHPSVWTGPIPAVVPLQGLMQLNEGQVSIDVQRVVDIVQEADKAAIATKDLVLRHDVKRSVRKEVRQVMKHKVDDPVLIAAWYEYGSMRKAATALTKKLGHPVTKDMVEDAINRANGTNQLRRTLDSASISRTVASQPRDRGKKMLQYGK